MKMLFVHLMLFSTFLLLPYAGVSAQQESRLSGLHAAVMADPSIIERVDAETGEVVYLRKSVSPISGEVTYTEVEYCAKTARFVNVAPGTAANCLKEKNANASAKVKETEEIQDAGGKSTSAAQRAACSSAGSKAKPMGSGINRRGSAAVKLVSN